MAEKGSCAGCYDSTEGPRCYRFYWTSSTCKCARCLILAPERAYPPPAVRAWEAPEDEEPVALEQGNFRLVLHLPTNVACEYDEARPKHSRCGDRFTPPDYDWLVPGSIVEGDVTHCPACIRRRDVETTGVKVGACSSCGALMYWTVGARGGRVPVSIKTGASHFADCPNAKQHSRKGRA